MTHITADSTKLCYFRDSCHLKIHNRKWFMFLLYGQMGHPPRPLETQYLGYIWLIKAHGSIMPQEHSDYFKEYIHLNINSNTHCCIKSKISVITVRFRGLQWTHSFCNVMQFKGPNPGQNQRSRSNQFQRRFNNQRERKTMCCITTMKH